METYEINVENIPKVTKNVMGIPQLNLGKMFFEDIMKEVKGVSWL